MRILLIGGTGFLGAHLSMAIKDDTVYTLSRKEHPGNHYVADIASLESLDKAFEACAPDIVVHLASFGNPRKTLAGAYKTVNILGTENVIVLCERYKVKKLIFSSSSSVYGEPASLPVKEDAPTAPISVYGQTKLHAEHLIIKHCARHSIAYTILRLGNLYGPGSPDFIAQCVQSIARGDPPTIFGDGMQTRDFLHIADAVDALISALHEGDNRIINVGSGTSTAIHEVVGIVAASLRVPVTPRYEDAIPGEVRRMQLDISLAKSVLKWQPRISLSDGIHSLVQHVKT